MTLRLPRAQGRTLLQLLNRQAAFHVPLVARAGLPIRHHSTPRRAFSSDTRIFQQQQEATSQPLGRVEPKLAMTFTCAVTDCGHRSTHEFSRRSYEKGIVIVQVSSLCRLEISMAKTACPILQCPSCMNRHLIADHLSWFTEDASDPKTIEQMIAAKGGKVKRGVSYVDGEGSTETVEMVEDEEEATKSG